MSARHFSIYSGYYFVFLEGNAEDNESCEQLQGSGKGDTPGVAC